MQQHKKQNKSTSILGWGASGFILIAIFNSIVMGNTSYNIE